MGTPLRKPRLVANDGQRPAFKPALLPLPTAPLPRATPHVQYVRLAPVSHRHAFSWAAAIAISLLAATIFLLGVVAGTVFWFTYDLTDNREASAPSLVMARLSEPLQKSPSVQPQIQPVAPADIVLPAEEPPPAPVSATADTGGMQLVIHEGEATDIDTLLEKARDHLEQGENDPALALYERVLAEEPKNTAALQGKAYALGRSTRTSPAALAELQRMVDAAPDDAIMQTALAKALAAHNKITEAIPHLDHALRLAPDDVASRFDLATLYDRAGQAPQALMLYGQILQLANDGNIPTLPPETLAAIHHRADYLRTTGIQK